MTRCEVCGNEYGNAFEVVMAVKSHVFDCFECAIHALAPICSCCGTRVIGHGVEVGGEIYCCSHCTRAVGHAEVADRT